MTFLDPHVTQGSATVHTSSTNLGPSISKTRHVYHEGFWRRGHRVVLVVRRNLSMNGPSPGRTVCGLITPMDGLVAGPYDYPNVCIMMSSL